MLFSLTGPRREVHYINFVRTHALNSVNVISGATPFLINRKHIGMYQAIFLRTQAGMKEFFQGHQLCHASKKPSIDTISTIVSNGGIINDCPVVSPLDC